MLIAPPLIPHGPASPFCRVQRAPKVNISLLITAAQGGLGQPKLAGTTEGDQAVRGRC